MSVMPNAVVNGYKTGALALVASTIQRLLGPVGSLPGGLLMIANTYVPPVTPEGSRGCTTYVPLVGMVGIAGGTKLAIAAGASTLLMFIVESVRFPSILKFGTPGLRKPAVFPATSIRLRS